MSLVSRGPADVSWRLGDMARSAAPVGCLAGAALAVSFFGAGSASADGAADQYLTGGWGGARAALSDRGVTAFGIYTAAEWANMSGGYAEGARYEGLLDAGVDLDLQKLAGLSGSRLYVDLHWNQSTLPSQELVGQYPTDVVFGNEAADSVRLYQLYLERRWGDTLRIKAGQIAIDNDFFVSTYASGLLNSSFAFFGSGRDLQAAPFYPLAGPGAMVQDKFAAKWTIRATLVTADPGQDTSSNHGFGWSVNNGVSVGAELATDRAPAGLPGRYTLGLLSTTKELRQFSDGSSVRGSYGTYLMIDQALAVDSQGNAKVGAFARVGYNPLLTRAVFRTYGNAGVMINGPLPGRGNDSFSVGYSHTNFAQDFLSYQLATGQNVAGRERVLEADYQAAVRPWFTLQPDVQWIGDPHYSRRNALGAGVQATITF